MLDTVHDMGISSSSVVDGAQAKPITRSAEIFKDRELLRWKYRQMRSKAFAGVCIAAVLCTAAILFWLLGSVVVQGYSWLSWDFLWNFPSRFPEKAGIKSAMVGSVWLMALTAMFAIPLGVGAAIFLAELMPDWRLKKMIEFNLLNLASVPSIVFGMLGLTVFVRLLALNRSLLAGALTLSILILPVIVIASREALRAVPDSLRQAAFAVGATRWQVTRDHVLPAAAAGIFTGIILSISRAIGEAAPLILVGALLYIPFVPEGPLDGFTALPIQIFNWAGRPQEEFHGLAAAGIIVMLGLLLSANAAAIVLRQRSHRKGLWHQL